MTQRLMIRSKYLVFTALFLLVVSSLFGCSGDTGPKGDTGNTGPAGPPGADASRVVDINNTNADEMASLKLTGQVTGVTIAGAPVVNFKVTDASGNAVIGLGAKNTAGTALNYLRFTIAKLVPGTNGSPDQWVNYLVTATTRPTTESNGTVVDNGNGTYTYTFATDITDPTKTGGVTYEPSLTHRLAVQVSGTVPGSAPALAIANPTDLFYDFVPAGGAVTTMRQIVSKDACNGCHDQIGVSTPHSGRIDTQYCVLCHTEQRSIGRTEATTTATGYSGSTYVINGKAVGNFVALVHRIHMGDALTKTGYNYGGVTFNDVKYPQDIRNCVKCHSASTATPQGDNWKNKPSRVACGACHDNIDFATGAGHIGGAKSDDSQCSLCHTATDIMANHIPVTPIASSILSSGVASGYTNAAAMAGYTNNLPAGASVITYDVDSASRDSNKHAVVKFKLKKDGTDVVFNSSGELMNNFVGSPSVYCAFSVPQDGITAPADFNASSSGNIKGLLAGTGGTLAGPDNSGYYTATLTNTIIPDSAAMLTCGIGYTYALPNTPPLTQTNVPGYSYNTTTKIGGLIVPAPNVWKVATGYTGRRVVVSTAKCNNCHGVLGLFLTEGFHAGQRNDAPTCSFCHNPNTTSSAWSADASTFIHGIHAADKRTTPFGWHETDVDDGFFNVGYPGILKHCEQCHVAGGYDFSGSMYTANNGSQGVSNMLYSTVGTGTYTAGALGLSPYVTPGTNYGSGFAFAGATGTSTEAAGTTLVNSPIASACFACHDSSTAMAHMSANGGSIYAARTAALATPEQCLICHASGKVADIRAVHYQ